MNTDDKLMTIEEATEWKYCERCGSEMVEESEYRYTYDTGEKYEDTRTRVCPQRNLMDSHHTRIELVGIPDGALV